MRRRWKHKTQPGVGHIWTRTGKRCEGRFSGVHQVGLVLDVISNGQQAALELGIATETSDFPKIKHHHTQLCDGSYRHICNYDGCILLDHPIAVC